MVVIAYGVCGEGMGHALRSSEVIDVLIKKGHEVHIFSSDRPYDYLKKKYDNVHEIRGFHLIYKGYSVPLFQSTAKIIADLPFKSFPSLTTVASVCAKIKPTIILSDHEPFCCTLGELVGIPVLALGNNSIADKTKTDKVESFSAEFTNMLVDRFSNFQANEHIIPTFFYPPKKKKTVFLTSPVVRELVRDAKVSKKNHIVVYHTSKTCLELLSILQKFPDETFHVYGFGKRKDTKNMTFHDFDDKNFVKHLSSAKAFVTGGGFTAISEALYLKKPILSLPLAKHYEQILNAHYIDKLSFGLYMKRPNKTSVDTFLSSIPVYEEYLDAYNFDPNEYTKTILKRISFYSKKKRALRVRILQAIARGIKI